MSINAPPCPSNQHGAALEKAIDVSEDAIKQQLAKLKKEGQMIDLVDLYQRGLSIREMELNNHQLKLVGSYNGLKSGYGSQDPFMTQS